MVDGPGIMNFDIGLSRILNQPDVEESQMPTGKLRLTPTDLGVSNVLNRLLSADNVVALLRSSLTPDIGDRDVLQPDKFAAAIEQSIQDIGQVLDMKDSLKLSKEEVAHLEALQDQLGQLQELKEQLGDFMNALIAG